MKDVEICHRTFLLTSLSKRERVWIEQVVCFHLYLFCLFGLFACLFVSLWQEC